MMRRVVLVVGLLAGLGPGPARAQAADPGSRGPESPHSIAAMVMALASDPAFVGGGLSVTQRVSAFLRVRAVGVYGVAGPDALGRGEVLLELLLDPGSRAWTPFGGGGVAGLLDQDGALDGRLVVLVGVEQRPASPRGWRFEAGLGGGLRVALGYRLAL